MIIAIANHKGGTGKTTTAINLGRALSMRNYKVLLVDLDAQGNLTYALGCSSASKTVADVLVNRLSSREAILSSNEMDLIPGGIQLNKASWLIQKNNSWHLGLRNALGEISNEYDFVLLDCPPSVSVYTINALNAAAGVVIPVQLDVLSVQGLDQILTEIEVIQKSSNPELVVLGVLGTIVHENRNLSYEILEYIRDNFSVHVFNNHIRSNVKAAEAPSFGISVLDYAPSSASARDYINFASEILMLLQSTDTAHKNSSAQSIIN